MKNFKSHTVLIPAIGAFTFLLSQWVIKSNNSDALFGLSADLLAGLIVGAGVGLMLLLLRQSVFKSKSNCE